MDLKGKKVLDTDCTGENCDSQEYNKAGNVLGVAASKNNKMLYFQSKTAIKKKEMEREVQKKTIQQQLGINFTAGIRIGDVV